MTNVKAHASVMLDTLQDLSNQLQQYIKVPGTQLFATISQGVSQLHSAVNWATPVRDTFDRLESLMVTAAHVEPVWALQAGLALWSAGRQQSHHFHNIWNCSRYAGIHSRYSPLKAEEHLSNIGTLYSSDQTDPASPSLARFIIRGNALRQLHRYDEAETAYLHGLDVYPDDPFLKFRLIDLWLMTYQYGRANELLTSLRARYPDALEMLFALPVPDTAIGPDKIMPALDADGADFVWLVAADPVYLQRYGLRLAQGIARQRGETIVKLHVHVVTEPDKPAPTDVLEAMARLIPLHVTQRQLDLSGASANQRKALFASERFLFLAEMLAKYQRPLLVSDIDVECLQNPHVLFSRMGGADIAHTRFSTVRDAWDRYPATVLLFQPTPAAISFCQRLSGMIITLLNNHRNPWFVDQVALFRLIEGGLTLAKLTYLEYLLTDTDSPKAYFRILHGSWQENAQSLFFQTQTAIPPAV